MLTIWVSETVELKDDRDDAHSGLLERNDRQPKSMVAASQIVALFSPDSLTLALLSSEL